MKTRVKIEYDTSPSNPFTDGDCEPPILVYSGRYDVTEYGLSLSPPTLTREQIAENVGAVKSLLDGTQPRSLLRALRTDCDMDSARYSDAVDLVNDALAEKMQTLSTSDQLEFLADVYRCAGIAAVCKSVRGYSQGDYAEVLAVALPEWVKRVGAPAESHARQLEHAVQLFGHYAFGDVYGYVIEKAVPTIVTYSDGREPRHSVEWEHEDSCWGFYGDDPAENGMVDYAGDEFLELLKDAARNVDKWVYSDEAVNDGAGRQVIA